MSRILNSLRDEFIQSQGLVTKGKDVDFEKFCNFHIIQSEYSKTLNPELVTVGAGNDTGIDGIAIITNGHLVEDVSEVDDLLEANGSLDVQFIFVQSKTSPSFDSGEMSKFYMGVTDFFKEEHSLPSNEDIKRNLEISDYIYTKASHFSSNPKVKLYYVTSGVFNGDEHLTAVRDTFKQQLIDMSMFSSVESELLGEAEITAMYRKANKPDEATFEFERKANLPKIEGVKEAYFGVLPMSEFKSILIDENGDVKNVFDDNVRDFQGVGNAVNKDILNTLSEDKSTEFSILNNGVTIVANDAKVTSSTFTIMDYQIVNGCQTSNVLYQHQLSNDIEGIYIPIRLIVTADDELKSRVTVSTNNQTTVKTEQLAAMSEFQKNLELYYSATSGEGQLYYERRSKQYAKDKNVVKKRVIPISAQIKTFSSMFHQNPHVVTTYYGNLVKGIGKKGSTEIFKDGHSYSIYYLSGLVYYTLEELFRKNVIDKKYRKVKFYITMLIPMLVENGKIPPLNSNRKCEEYMKRFSEILLDLSRSEELFLKAVEIIDGSGAPIEDKQALKSQKMTSQILEHFKTLSPEEIQLKRMEQMDIFESLSEA
ncbi:AIPR family protein [Vibrio caribbeanicus]|uniref:Abortive phage infection protein C-terminal domain-containing protein n=1 Tax=Vibrio caribbeanicus ATCC BAA-2122 TaxID=796620 RepID=E3BE98_9VIBR|nr:AIPR family protein [Vibrio caribbeanicus]EFP98515.1 hypothetical protein VIBC2010_08208 [Vibrio caribbeanicus ATCC BAA-2122]